MEEKITETIATVDATLDDIAPGATYYHGTDSGPYYHLWNILRGLFWGGAAGLVVGLIVYLLTRGLR